MKKVGIITINDYTNYGNRLQNYAVQEVLISLGCEVETVVNLVKSKRSFTSAYPNIRDTKLIDVINKMKKKVYRKIPWTREHKLKKLLLDRKTAFKNFTHENINETSFIITPEEIPESLSSSYDAFVVGSDQVWNPNYGRTTHVDFLTFAPPHKRISYAASFGVSKIPDNQRNMYRDWLSKMEHISVREDAGAKIIEELIKKKAEVIVDPTLMLSKSKWMSIAKPIISKPKKPFLLTYFLGQVKPENIEIINSIAKSYDLDIVNMADINDKNRYVVDPGEFLSYINSSEIFLIDSFHGAVFSILFEKPFYIFDRIEKIPSTNSRIDTLLKKFELEVRRANNIQNLSTILEVDFSHVKPILEEEREKTIKFLKNALHL